MSKKSTKAEVEIRIAEIAKLLIEGKPTQYIIPYSAKKWEIGVRQTTNYIKRATEKITKSVNKNLERDFSLAVQRFQDLYNKAYDNNDLRLCRMINKDLSELQELSKHRIEHNVNINKRDLEAMSDEELQAIIDEDERGYK